MDNNSEPLASNGQGAIDIHQPFTPAERIRQLDGIDKDITSSLVHLSSAMRALATPPGTSVPPASTPASDDDDDDDNNNNDSDPLSAFQQAQSAFFNTVDRVDKQLTRQILALEEAGIITLRSTGAGTGAELGDQQQQGSSQQQQQQQQQQEAKPKAAAAGPARLEPDGMGRYGSLDVGKLNLASSTVERDMEGELWGRMRAELEKVVAQGKEDLGAGEKMEE
ncbi:hypothetical protein NEMBOFW57_005800 [Staphylotrichum longicolle]|uniref:Mediator of RNA polymerase II transcription subunit 11 n=1 Tax=Staphylotrichum longicolle TaxID=669026 RepID=A0AAD4HWB4_9PEZI|nr:hypothetical protein NEMBOFW57_005800 [Staphylotrichum longicolle]